MTYEPYYVPAQSPWPIIGSISLFTLLFGGALILQQYTTHISMFAYICSIGGLLGLIFMLAGWFNHVIIEAHQGLYSAQMDRSFRWGMIWFIFSEIMFFVTFFSILYYIRMHAVPNLDQNTNPVSGLLWPEFKQNWPLLQNPNNQLFPGPREVINPWQLPLLNTILLVTSSLTLTIAHHAIRFNQRIKTIIWLALTVCFGLAFLFFQAEEYIHAYQALGLTLNSGIYGSTFFLLTGFHGFHVTLGTLILIIILARMIKGHFSAEQHFGFEAASWYWHFVDVVWIGLFLFVYVL
ncbi:MAG: cytochrome c oxidase subunit 3 [Endozoicomonadaceae bacterium]|nr:cytochrome c oxidase subunit 3 [Endozoicomonadaceae bacterium]